VSGECPARLARAPGAASLSIPGSLPSTINLQLSTFAPPLNPQLFRAASPSSQRIPLVTSHFRGRWSSAPRLRQVVAGGPNLNPGLSKPLDEKGINRGGAAQSATGRIYGLTRSAPFMSSAFALGRFVRTFKI